jgi:hypothetical protein
MSDHKMKLAERELAPPDPMQPTADVVIDGDVYRLCFDNLALAEAEEEMIRAGHDVCLLVQLPRLTLKCLFVNFTAAARKYQPWLKYEDALELVKPQHYIAVANALHECWEKCRAPKEPTPEVAAEQENPQDPS